MFIDNSTLACDVVALVLYSFDFARRAGLNILRPQHTMILPTDYVSSESIYVPSSVTHIPAVCIQRFIIDLSSFKL